MFGSNKTKTKTTKTGNTTSNNTGFLSKLRSSNRPASANKPVYKTGATRTTTGTSKTGISKKQKNKTVATGPAPMSHHRAKPTLSQKIHGVATIVSGKMHNDHQEVRAGEKEMQGKKSTSSGLFGKRTSTTTRNTKRI